MNQPTGKPRRQFTPDDKATILRRHLADKVAVSVSRFSENVTRGVRHQCNPAAATGATVERSCQAARRRARAASSF